MDLFQLMITIIKVNAIEKHVYLCDKLSIYLILIVAVDRYNLFKTLST